MSKLSRCDQLAICDLMNDIHHKEGDIAILLEKGFSVYSHEIGAAEAELHKLEDRLYKIKDIERLLEKKQDILETIEKEIYELKSNLAKTLYNI